MSQAPPAQSTPVERITGKVKKVNSGDTIVIWSRAPSGQPIDQVLHLANIIAPKVAVYTPDQNQKDEPCGWEAREHLRKSLIGCEVFCEVEHRTPKAVFGYVFKGKTNEDENLNETIVSLGFASVKEVGKKNERYDKLKELQEEAKGKKLGMWSDTKGDSVRKIKWSPDNANAFVEKCKRKPHKAIIEGIHPSASAVRAFLPLNDTYYYMTVNISGIRGPNEESGLRPRAIYFLEMGLLQCEVEITLDGVGNNGQFFGQIRRPKYDIVLGLIQEGLAQTADWSLASMDQQYAAVLRKAEQQAKEKKLLIWKDYKAPVRPQLSADGATEMTAKVVEIVAADMIVLKENNGNLKKVFLSSIRPPKQENSPAPVPSDRKMTAARRMFESPLLFEAREFLRTKLIGKPVNVSIDYIQPKSEMYPEKVCCTVTIGGVNIAEALVSKGLAGVIRYKQDNDQRSAHYHELQAAEAHAQKSQVGMYSKKELAPLRVLDLQGDLQKSKQYLPGLQRANTLDAVVEFVSSGSRVRVYVPKQNCLFALLLSGISCPRASRPEINNMPAQKGDAWGDEAIAFTRDLCLQHQVEIEVENMDKVGSMIGFLFIDRKNISLELVRQGFAEVHHPSAERTRFYKELCAAEEQAKQKRLRRWKDFVETVEETKQDNETEEEKKADRKVDYKSVMVSEVTSTVDRFYVQFANDAEKLEELQAGLQSEMKAHPPLSGAYTPKRFDKCAAKFVDGNWYRARVDKIQGGKAEVVYIDYGNREESEFSKLASLPGAFGALPDFARSCFLAFCKMPKDEEELNETRRAFQQDVAGVALKTNLEYKIGNDEYVTLWTADGKTDIGKGLVGDGLAYFEPRKGDRYRKMCDEYSKAQDSAKKERKCLWQYGDSREDENERM